MNIFKEKLKNFAPTTTIKNITANITTTIKNTPSNIKNITPSIKNLAENAKNSVKSFLHVGEDDCSITIEEEFVEIHPRIFHMAYPSKDKIKTLSKYLNENHKTNYYIWNVSEHTYDTAWFQNQVSEYCLVGYPCLPLALMLSICRSVVSWLENDKKNIAIIHCQSTKGRSALIISCLLCLMKVFTHPSEALIHFCKKTRSDENQVFFPSQHLYMKYFGNLIVDKIKMSTATVTIQKIIFSEVPRVANRDSKKFMKDNVEEPSFKPYIQIFKNSKILYNSLAKDQVLSFSSNDISLWFEPKAEVSGDILIRCKHFHTNEVRYPVFRILFNTGFVFDNVLRFYKRDIDFSAGITVSDDFFVDIILNLTQNDTQELNLNQIVGQLEEQSEFLRANTRGNTEERVFSDKDIINEIFNDAMLNAQLKEVEKDNFVISDQPDESPQKPTKEETENKELVNQILTKINADQDLHVDEKEIDDYFSKLEGGEGESKE